MALRFMAVVFHAAAPSSHLIRWEHEYLLGHRGIPLSG